MKRNCFIVSVPQFVHQLLRQHKLFPRDRINDDLVSDKDEFESLTSLKFYSAFVSDMFRFTTWLWYNLWKEGTVLFLWWSGRVSHQYGFWWPTECDEWTSIKVMGVIDRYMNDMRWGFSSIYLKNIISNGVRLLKYKGYERSLTLFTCSNSFPTHTYDHLRVTVSYNDLKVIERSRHVNRILQYLWCLQIRHLAIDALIIRRYSFHRVRSLI